MKKPIEDARLQSWTTLNNALRTADEELCHLLLKREQAGRKRSRFLKRIHGRLNRVRAKREREELGS